VVELASTCRVRGVLADGGVALTAKHLAMKSGIPEAVFAAAIPRLIDLGWLEDSAEVPAKSPDAPAESPDVPGKTSAYRDRDRDITETKNTSNRDEALLTPKNIEHVRRELKSHRRTGALPDVKIARRILAAFKDMADFNAWLADIRRN